MSNLHSETAFTHFFLTGEIERFEFSGNTNKHLLKELSPSWEAANCAATQELPSILRNPKIHHRVHKSPPLDPSLIQIDLVHTMPSPLSKIYFNIVHPPT
jgi:hypothetical protein